MTHGGARGRRAGGLTGQPALLAALRAAQDGPEELEGEQDGQPVPASERPSRQSYSVAAQQAPLRQDAAVLLVMALLSTVALGRLWSSLAPHERGWLVGGYGALPLACLVLLKARPAAYRANWHWLAWLHHGMLAMAHQFVDIAPALQSGLAAPAGSSGSAAGTFTWLAVLSIASGTNAALTMLLCFQLPPVATAASACCLAAALANVNGRVCASAFLQLPASTRRMEAHYRWLEPLVAPLEPLLLAAGLGRDRARRHCLCVLAVQQFWLVAVLPTLLVALQQVRSYRRWRARQRQLARERRQQQAEAWNFPFKEPSSSSVGGSSNAGSDSTRHSRHSGSSSGGSERDFGHRGGGGGMGGAPPLARVPLSSQLPAAYRRQLVVIRHAPARVYTQPHHPDDWQWAAAERTLRALRPTYRLAAAAALAAAVAGAWHQQAFP